VISVTRKREIVTREGRWQRVKKSIPTKDPTGTTGQ
jgi:hypothetical protein